ncbi:MAG: hypothetical protein Q7S58_03345 [Candidatus Binatus sp.]|uniref:hypothetical protein n=1 Tax=Candidatus Binatus sp. TaxID=2811406 RepID=UPI0027251F2B|nr:hypothetical protein [Candidatus Binatus sp.]MDO8431425.1 hypothetical protein [Candidatus Binatus sp.]
MILIITVFAMAAAPPLYFGANLFYFPYFGVALPGMNLADAFFELSAELIFVGIGLGALLMRLKAETREQRWLSVSIVADVMLFFAIKTLVWLIPQFAGALEMIIPIPRSLLIVLAIWAGFRYPQTKGDNRARATR